MKTKNSEETVSLREKIAAGWDNAISTVKGWNISVAAVCAVAAALVVSIGAAFIGRGYASETAGGSLVVLLLLGALFILLMSRLASGAALSAGEVCLVSFFAAVYCAAAAFTRNFSGGIAGGGFDPWRASRQLSFLPSSMVLPTALFVIFTGIMVNARLAKVIAVIFPVAALVSGSMSGEAFIFALATGIAAALVTHHTYRRADLLRAGLVISAAAAIVVLASMVMQHAPLFDLLGAAACCVVHGVGTSSLALGLFPALEALLHKATDFRLLELLDLDAPIMKRLSATAPGTFTHSLVVANLAEAACQAIGASALLARAGAYFHDIGKIENPDYFVENQKIYNKHTELNPRLSATVIRSHVKLGIEKARSLHLPEEVIDIIASHHGNSLIAYFYNAALEKEGAGIEREDFTYPGHPPRSKEAAVVMLADVAEAAVRTLENPTAPRIEKFIQDLITRKMENGQLAESELRFRDLEIIKNSFVRTLVSYHHSRIEYPKPPDAALTLQVTPQAILKEPTPAQ